MGTAYYDIDNFELPYPVNVVGFTIAAPAGQPAFAPGTPAVGSMTTISGETVQDINSNSGASEGMMWGAAVTLNGPNGNSGITKMKVGFIQNVIGFQNDGIYSNGKTLHSNLDSQVSSQKPALDVYDPSSRTGNGARPWFTPAASAFFTPASSQNASGTISAADSPQMGPPITNNGFPLNQILLQFKFNLEVCVETLDTDNGANKLNVVEANAIWSFNGDAQLVKQGNGSGTWQLAKEAADNPPSPNAWQAQGPTPTTLGAVFNYTINRNQKWR